MSAASDTPTDRQTADVLRRALYHLGRQENAAAETLLQQILTIQRDHVDALHLLGQLRRVQNRFAEAEVLYRRVLERVPQRVEAHYHLGQLLRITGRVPEAIAALREAVRIKANFVEAHLELGYALAAIQDYDGAEQAYRCALNLRPNFPAASQALSAALIQLERHKDAELVARSALAFEPPALLDRAALSLNRAISLSGQHSHDDALRSFAQAEKAVPDLPQLAYNRANTLQMMGKLDEAESAYLDAIRSNPLDMKAHHALALLRYRGGRSDFLASYDEAMRSRFASVAHVTEKARLLLTAERNDEAHEHFLEALKLAPDEPSAREGLACALTRLGRFGEAADAFSLVLDMRPNATETLCSFAECLLRSGDPAKALGVSARALELEPHGQLALALWGIALAQQHDGREQSLNDYDKFVQLVDLEPPDGFADLAAFHQALEAELDPLHTDVREHLNQTSRSGTKTMGTLFGTGHPTVEKLRLRIDAAVASYVAAMPDIPDHPFLGRRGEGFRYAGSWSTRLSDCGYHTNHVHPRGWISSAYYVELPDVAGDKDAKRGWLKFGEPAFAVPLAKSPQRFIQPQPGRLVLFPSYMWHGTVPFHSDQRRATIAFDAVPA